MRQLPLLAIAVVALLTACGGAPGGPVAAGWMPGRAAGPPPERAGPIRAATVTVGGRSQTVLVDSRGMTLYYFIPDRGGRATCAGGCARSWPPLMLPSGTETPFAPDGLSGSVGTVASPDGGTQLTFDGWPLYRFAGDTAPGMAAGQGQGGKWFAVTAEIPQS